MTRDTDSDWTPAAIRAADDPEQRTARAIAFVISSAELSLDLDTAHLPLSARIPAILAACVQNPRTVDADTYRLLYLMGATPGVAEVRSTVSAFPKASTFLPFQT
jgi:hypothetical protein